LPVPREVFHQELSVIQKKHFPASQPLPGVPKLLNDLANTSAPKVHIALATSSHRGNFDVKTAHLQQLFSVFSEDQRVLGDDSRIPPGKGKPAPEIYLLALKTINDGLKKEGKEEQIKAEECLVFEDSVPGIEAGRRAGMRVVWVPHPGLLQEYAGREEEVLAGLTGEHNPNRDEASHAVKLAKDDIRGQEERSGEKVNGSPGNLDDGWGELLPNLENFPYLHYGINIATDQRL
jgi:pseudouridine-5'-monophosphatase